MNILTLSDEQVIERVRRAQRYRRPLGALCLIVGLAGGALLVYWVHDLSAQALALSEGMARAPQPGPQQIAKAVDEFRFYLGFALGSCAAGGLAAAIECAGVGLGWLLMRNRKDRLLLKCWDERAGGQEAAAAVERPGGTVLEIRE